MSKMALALRCTGVIWRNAVIIYLVSALVTACAFTGWTTEALALAPFEKPPVVDAKVLVTAKFLKGKNYTVNRKVPTNGFLGWFTLRTQYGKMEVHGCDLLQIRVGEIRAIQALYKLSKTKVFATAAKDAALRPINAVKQVIEKPGETLEGVPAGVERFFHNTYRQAKKTTMDVVDTVSDYAEEKPENTTAREKEQASRTQQSDKPGMAEKVVTKAGDTAKDFFGYNKARRGLAKQLKIDPYTTNPILKEKLDETAWATFAGGMTFKVAVPIPDAISYTTRVSDLVWDLSPPDLEELNEKKLQAMGIEGRPVRELFRHNAFSPTVTTSLVAALDQLTGVTGREEVVTLATSVASEEEARYLTGSVQILARYHRKVTPITRVKAIGTVVGWNQDGNVIVPLYADYIAWTRRVAEFAQHPELRTKERSLLVSGKFSPLARQELTSLGWTIREDVQVTEER